jgi:hypothetical protein
LIRALGIRPVRGEANGEGVKTVLAIAHLAPGCSRHRFVQPTNFSISETVDEMIVHHADRLHVRIDDGRTNAAECPLFEILTEPRSSQEYQEMHCLVREPDGSTVLCIGAENWPFPIPLVSNNGEWYFDSDRGKREILFRRIGENGATAIQVCEEFAMANNASATKAASEDPITQFVANADNKKSNPFHGYHFRIVTQNSAFQVSGRSERKEALTLVAYPAEYQSSGVMSFLSPRMGSYIKGSRPQNWTWCVEIGTRCRNMHSEIELGIKEVHGEKNYEDDLRSQSGTHCLPAK